MTTEEEYADPAYYLHRLIQRLMVRQNAYQLRQDYAIGDHPLPETDKRYHRALRNIQQKALTNYVGLANKAVTDRMRIRCFKFGGEVDEEAKAIWRANNMELNAQIAISLAAELSDVYALVSPPDVEGGYPLISIEDPRTCIIEPHPLNPLEASVGLKFYEDSIAEKIIAVLYFPNLVYTYEGPSLTDFLTRESMLNPENIVNSVGGFDLVSVEKNPLGRVPLVRGAWQPHRGLSGMAECEDGGFDIQDRINWVVLSRLIITKSQAYRQRWATGISTPKDSTGAVKQTPFEPGADMVWAVVSPEAKFGDFEQADLRQALEAARDDIGDFAAITQTPVTYLTNKMVNVSGDTLTVAQSSLVTKAKTRQEAMGWFFEQVIKLCFQYMGDDRSNDSEARTIWNDPEIRTMMETADMVAKFSAAGIPLDLILEKAGFSPEEVSYAKEEAERMKQEEIAMQERQMQMGFDAQKENTEMQVEGQKETAKTMATSAKAKQASGTKPSAKPSGSKPKPKSSGR